MQFMAREHGPALDTMRQIKAALDPHDLMNPGKVIPARAPEVADPAPADPAPADPAPADQAPADQAPARVDGPAPP
jgi:hypothetical protein